MRIREVKLLTGSIEAVRSFYHEVLEQAVLQESEDVISLKIGESILTFTRSDQSESPYYHFAFNIPERKCEQALNWLKQKGISVHSANGHEIEHSESWNSDSIYFYDSVGNIVEFIARHDLKDEDATLFTAADIKNISEIGLPAQDVIAVSEVLRDKYDLQVYKSSGPTFTPLGDEEGLFILAAVGRIWFASDKAAKYFPVTIDISDGRTGNEFIIDEGYVIKS
ncbi:VOC family protein [Paenibacillus sp. SN-8-1]|uniref:VOC family protein n=1 Tax=Paenibacillus sp. SN-8-1 TaxID=3435409 RepID=UPI003D9A1870